MAKAIHTARIFGAAVFLLLALVAARAQQSSGVYTMSVGGNVAATESYTITSEAGGSLKADAEISIRGTKQKTTTIIGKDRPLSFTAEAGGAKVISAEFDGQKVRLQVAGRGEREVVTKATVILENVVWHQYIFLLNRYPLDRGGTQSFTAFLPSQGVDVDARIERAATETYEVKGQKVAAERYSVVTTSGLVIDIWADQSRTPLVFRITAQNVKVVRSGSEDLAEAIMKAEANMKPATTGDFISEEVTFQNGDVKLSGTLTLPKSAAARVPAAIIVSGSGPQDRDGSGMGMGLYRQIAERLTLSGVAVLRHDDRGVGQSLMPKKPTSYRDLVGDSRAGVEYLRGRKEIDPDRIMMVGHSEGGTTSAIIASEDPRIAAIVLLAGATLANLDKLLLEQIHYQQALERPFNPLDRDKYPDVVQWLLARIEEAKAGKQDAAATDLYDYLRHHLALNLPETYRRIKCPVLILQGERDALVLPHHALDAAKVLTESGNKRVTVRIFPNLSHIFAPSPHDTQAEARKKGEVSPEVLDTIKQWASEVLGPRGSK